MRGLRIDLHRSLQLLRSEAEVSQYFSRRELWRSRKALELGIDNEPPAELYAALDRTSERMDRVRDFLAFPIHITSGFRCPKLNLAVGGAEDSQHLKAEAVDFVCPGFGTHVEVFSALALRPEEFQIDQLILEPGWVHVSFKDPPRLEVLHRLESGRYVSLQKPLGKKPV